MTEEQLKIAAAQLRKPNGENAIDIAERMNEGNRQLYENTISVLEINDNDTILEIGMGNGFFVNPILNKANNIKYHGCDYSLEMVSESNKLNDKLVKLGDANFHLANANNLPFSENKFDLIFSVNTIYFWDNTKAILSEFKRVLKPHGKLVLALRPEDSMQHYPFAKFGFKLYSKEKVGILLDQNNFHVTSIIEKEESTYKVEEVELKVESLIVTADKVIPVKARK